MNINFLIALSIIALFLPSAARANSCGPPKRLKVPLACGKVLDGIGNPIPSLGISLVSTSGMASATTTTNQTGRFSFSNVKPGSYDLCSKSESFDEICWPVKVSQANESECKHPLYMMLSRKSGWSCLSWVTKNEPALKTNDNH